MLGTMTRWVQDESARWTMPVFLALMMVAAAVAVRADEATKHFDIRAQPLSEALMAFGAQTGAIVMASSELTTGKISNPVTGQLTLQAALTRMLQGTGLNFETNANGTILILRTPLPAVRK
jgi:iron complex outermembrane receptor protein